jgi:hypothetical protein
MQENIKKQIRADRGSSSQGEVLSGDAGKCQDIRGQNQTKKYSKAKLESLVACAYAKGVADGCKHMLQV